MGRSRRRNRRGFFGAQGHFTTEQIITPEPPKAPAATLTPTYVPIIVSHWDAESDTPVLPLEGLHADAAIASPSLIIDQDPGPSIALTPDSEDPEQLDLVVLAESASAEPIVVAEAEPEPPVPVLAHIEEILEAEPEEIAQ